MPCSDGGPYRCDDKDCQGRADRAAKAACEMFELLPGDITMSTETTEWFLEHIERDNGRRLAALYRLREEVKRAGRLTLELAELAKDPDSKPN